MDDTNIRKIVLFFAPFQIACVIFRVKPQYVKLSTIFNKKNFQGFCGRLLAVQIFLSAAISM